MRIRHDIIWLSLIVALLALLPRGQESQTVKKYIPASISPRHNYVGFSLAGVQLDQHFSEIHESAFKRTDSNFFFGAFSGTLANGKVQEIQGHLEDPCLDLSIDGNPVSVQYPKFWELAESTKGFRILEKSYQEITVEYAGQRLMVRRGNFAVEDYFVKLSRTGN